MSLQTSFLASAFIFVFYTMSGEKLTPDKVFPTMFLLNIFKIQAGLFLSAAIQFWTNYKVSQKRIEEILLLDNFNEKSVDFDKQVTELGLPKDTTVFFKNFNGYWPEAKKEKKKGEKAEGEAKDGKTEETKEQVEEK